MPCTREAIHYFHQNDVYFGPAKAANAGGVVVSGLEMSQNSMRMQWDRDVVDEKLRSIMTFIYASSLAAAKEYDTCLENGANIAGFLGVAEAMLDQGAV